MGLIHICYEVHDIESLRNAYIKLGLNPPEAKKFRAGNLLFVLRDPEGQIVEFTQYLPGSLRKTSESISESIVCRIACRLPLPR